MIELLVVIAIIALLAGMLFAVLPMIIFNAKASVTVQRMEEVTRNFTAMGQEEGSAALVLASQALQKPNECGVLKWISDGWDKSTLSPATPALTYGTWLSAADQHFRWPWGQAGLDAAGIKITASSSAADKLESSRGLSKLSPHRSMEFMQASGLLPSAIPPATDSRLAYYSDRNPKSPWNDKWGNPLVIAYGYYQPFPDWTSLNHAHLAYQYDRALYLCVASAGPELSTPLVKSAVDSDWNDPTTGNYRTIWNQVNDVCNSELPSAPVSGGGTELWRTDFTVWAAGTDPVNAFTQQPWRGVRKGTVGNVRSFLSAPIELK